MYNHLFIGGGNKITKVRTVVDGCADGCDDFKIMESAYNGTDEKSYECENFGFCAKLYIAIKEAEGNK